jgi:hypothetical protein
MFVPRIGQRLFLSLALGLILLPSISWATTVTIPAPYNTAALYTNNSGTPFAVANNSQSLPAMQQYNSVSLANNGAAAPNTVYFSTYDISNSAFIVAPAIQDSTHALAAYNAVNDAVRSASDSGAYDAAGVTSGFAGVDAAHGNNTMGVGVLLNDAGVIGDPGNPLYGPTGDLSSPWLGVNKVLMPDGSAINLSQFDTLVMYTYLGDSFLRGTVDSNDIFQATADKNTLPSSNTWGFGDYFYQVTGGTAISGVDIFAATASKSFVNAHTYPLTVTFAQGAAGAAVPEPTSIALMALGALASAIVTFRMRRGRVAAR